MSASVVASASVMSPRAEVCVPFDSRITLSFSFCFTGSRGILCTGRSQRRPRRRRSGQLLTVVDSLFSTDPRPDHRQLPTRLGLIDDSDDRWTSLLSQIDRLNASDGDGASYKLVFLGRHGQGYR